MLRNDFFFLIAAKYDITTLIYMFYINILVLSERDKYVDSHQNGYIHLPCSLGTHIPRTGCQVPCELQWL